MGWSNKKESESKVRWKYATLRAYLSHLVKHEQAICKRIDNSLLKVYALKNLSVNLADKNAQQ